MRSVIKEANPTGIKAIVEQQFELGKMIVAAGFIPILEPEVDIHTPNKAEAEAILKQKNPWVPENCGCELSGYV